MRHILPALVCVSVLSGFQCSGAQGQGERVLQQLYRGPSTNDTPTCLVQGSDGNYYGTKAGASGQVFRMTPAGTVTRLALLQNPNPELTLADDGNIYGTTAAGGLGYGTIFEVTPAGQVTTVYQFTSLNRGPVGMRKGWDGALYGATAGSVGGHLVPEPITLFQFTIFGGSFTTLYSATNTSNFTTSPVLGSDGSLYGTGTFDIGFGFSSGATIYRFFPGGGPMQILRRLTNSAIPGGLIFGSDGALYGPAETQNRFTNTDDGVIFRITTNGVFTNFVTFDSTNGANPSASLCLASDGAFYGVTSHGGLSNLGTIFHLTTNGDLTTLIHFGAGNSGSPQSALIESSSDGNFYGTTAGSGPFEPGIVFRLVQPPTLAPIFLSNNAPVLSWNSFTDAIYRVDYKSTLNDAAWSTLVSRVTGVDTTISFSDVAAAAEPQRFYRVVLLP